MTACCGSLSAAANCIIKEYYIVALDQCTPSSRAILFDHKENIISMAQKEFPQIYPQNGWVEHDPMEIYSGQFGVMMEAMTRGGIRPEEIAAIGITNQRKTTPVWEKATASPICNAIVWQCDRSFTPNMTAEQRQLGKKNRAKAVGKSRQWENS